MKYCFRYNQRNRQARIMGENGEPIDLANMPTGRPHRRRREKKLMSMEEVNERFPLTKYKAWRASREASGLPAEGGVTAPPSRAPSIMGKDVRHSSEEEPQTALELAQQQHAAATTTTEVTATAGAERRLSTSSSTRNNSPPGEKTGLTSPTTPPTTNPSAPLQEVDLSDDEESDPIAASSALPTSSVPGDTCAICLDTLEETDDIRGLTCGHAFHAACVDPWLTGRRACCPLCKADYYVAKPRQPGDADAGGRVIHPPPAWFGGRGGGLLGPMRPRFGTSGFTAAQQPGYGLAAAAAPSRSSGLFGLGGRRVLNSRDGQASVSQAGSGSAWRSRLPAMRMSRRFLGGSRTRDATPVGSAHGPVGEVATPGQLEAGRTAGR